MYLSGMSDLTTKVAIVMYHYVRPIQGSKYPRIKGLELSEFKTQLDFLESISRIISPEEFYFLSDSSQEDQRLCSLLTFDDGLVDHYENVFPELQRRKLKALFFPSSLPYHEKKIANVHKIQFVLEAFQDTKLLLRKIEEILFSIKFDLNLTQVTVPNSVGHYDNPPEKQVKYLLQRAFPIKIRNLIVNELFQKYVSRDEEDFLHTIYMSNRDLLEMRDCGMEIGSHGSQHNWLEDMTIQDQQSDVSQGIEFVDALYSKSEKKMTTFSYPFGSYNSGTLEILKNERIDYAFTVKKNFYQSGVHAHLEVPRFDTNDVYEALKNE